MTTCFADTSEIERNSSRASTSSGGKNSKLLTLKGFFGSNRKENLEEEQKVKKLLKNLKCLDSCKARYFRFMEVIVNKLKETKMRVEVMKKSL